MSILDRPFANTIIPALGITLAGAAAGGGFVRDGQAEQDNSNRTGPRYVITQTLLVRSTQPDKIAAASQKVAELVAEGVVLSSGEQYGNGGPMRAARSAASGRPTRGTSRSSRATRRRGSARRAR